MLIRAASVLLAAAIIASCSSTTVGTPVAQQSTTAVRGPAAQPPKPTSTSPPTPSDEEQVRQTVKTFQDAYNTENWDAYLDVMCAPMRSKFSATVMDTLKKDRQRAGVTTTTITKVSITGDTATAYMNSHNEALGSASVSLPLKREEDGWKICQSYP